ncbi:MAG: bacillithiol biosynthesis cysteine-adding enzyme BshC [candidate division Zixibacteria bacterium]|nr:bacillithiol biosynthesis cysteine-adding enzyme BshC [candidate division Zixibacteria bacterium]
MAHRLIPSSKQLGYSDLYLDVLAEKPSAGAFFHAKDPAAVARAIDHATYPRRELVDILTRQNRQFHGDDSVFRSLTSLAVPGSMCVFSGQQAGLFTGPMLVVVKALALVKLARAYSLKLNRSVVPIFWIAGDDHDFDEIANTWVLNQQSELVEIKYGARPEQELPVGDIVLSNHAELDRVKDLYTGQFGRTDFTEQLRKLVDRSYTPEDTFVSSFGKMLAGLTAGTGLVLFNPCDAEVKSLAVPFFEQVIDRQDELHKTLASSNKAIEEAGYHLQVTAKDHSAHLFRNINGRKPVQFEAGSFSFDGVAIPLPALKSAVRSHPERFSPDVMTRPLMQSYLFPVLCQLGGPAEIAYLAQGNALFDLFGIPAPIQRPRPSLTLIEKRIDQLMTEHGVTFNDLTGDIEQAVNRVLAGSFPKELEQRYADLTAEVKATWDRFAGESLQFDPSLGEFAKQTYGKVDFALKGFEGKLFSAHKKKSKDVRDRIYRVHRNLYPNRTLQERTLNIGCFVARHGFGVVSFMLEQMDVDQTAHQLIDLAEMTSE